MPFYRNLMVPVLAVMAASGMVCCAQFTAHAQAPLALGASPVCSASTATETELSRRKGSLERSLAEKRRQLERTSQEARKALLREIGGIEGDLVDVIYLLDCHRTDWDEQARDDSGAPDIADGQESAGADQPVPQPSSEEAPKPPLSNKVSVEPMPRSPGSGGGRGSYGYSGRSGYGGAGGGGGTPMARPTPSPGDPAPGGFGGARGGGEDRASPAPPPPSGEKASTEKPGAGDFVEITSYYATNRKPTGNVVPAEFYGTEDGQMQYGRMVVTIPAAHTVGNIELPSLWKLEFNADPSKHFTIKELAPLETGTALGELRETVSKAGSRSLLLFVHGFNVTFAEAGLRTAQLAHDLAFQGVPMFMSWPASRLYTHDVEAVEVAEGSLDKLLDDIAVLPFDNVYILAHSMGTRLVSRVLADRLQRGADVRKIRDLMLAAPDINAQIFTTQIAPVLSRMTSARKTIYASSNDLALRASVAIQGYRRVGETNGGVQTFPGFDTIDCSSVASLQRSWGHSYLFDSNLVLADLIDMLIGGKAAAQRKLMRTGVAPALYWLLQAAP